MRLGTKNFRDTATAGEETWVDEEELVGGRQLVDDHEVGESQQQVAAGRVADDVDALDFAGEGVEDGQVAVDDVVEGRRELVFGRHAVLDDEEREVGVEGDAGEPTAGASAAGAFRGRR